jgi:hypothetical protein
VPKADKPQRSKIRAYSITSSARASSTGGTSEGKRLSGQAVVMSG